MNAKNATFEMFEREKFIDIKYGVTYVAPFLILKTTRIEVIGHGQSAGSKNRAGEGHVSGRGEIG